MTAARFGPAVFSCRFMNLQSTDFELFGVPSRFTQDVSVLDARWKELQREAHPDRFAAQGAAAQRVAMQWSVRINEAYQRLKDPTRRAAYLCELRGAPIDAERNTAMPPAFLMQQMEWREALDEARDEGALDMLAAQVRHARTETLARCERLLDVEDDAVRAATEVRALMFIRRFEEELGTRYEQLGQ
jgi:molecular chaperone HscB